MVSVQVVALAPRWSSCMGDSSVVFSRLKDVLKYAHGLVVFVERCLILGVEKYLHL